MKKNHLNNTKKTTAKKLSKSLQSVSDAEIVKIHEMLDITTYTLLFYKNTFFPTEPQRS